MKSCCIDVKAGTALTYHKAGTALTYHSGYIGCADLIISEPKVLRRILKKLGEDLPIVPIDDPVAADLFSKGFGRREIASFAEWNKL